jgi:hypothetical protein
MKGKAMTKWTIDNGLLVDTSTKPPTCAGYIFNFDGHGAFAPGGKVGDLTPEQISAHNRLLGQMEVEALKKHGKGILYLATEKCADGFERSFVQSWDGSFKALVCNRNTSRNNSGATRIDVWFSLDGSNWHGVNIGDNDIVRVSRCKA